MVSKLSNSNFLGFDILPMSSMERNEGARVAVFILMSNGESTEHSSLTRHELIQIIKKRKIKYVGTDNPHEILSVKETINSFCKKLPYQTSLVHVNLAKNGNTIRLSSLVSQFKLKKAGKASAVETARFLVYLMKLGVGMILEPFENETMIEVGRPRRPGKGGWSENRYARQGEEIVARSTQEIKNSLQILNFTFDLISKKTKFGAKHSRFHVFLPKFRVIKILNKLSIYPAKIKIWSPTKKVLSFKPLSSSEMHHREQYFNHLQRIVVGIDPGITTGVAISNLKGKIIRVFSRKNLSKGAIVTEITNYGIPVLVCSDVNPAPNLVSKLAATYNAQTFSPEFQLKRDDKKNITKAAYTFKRIDTHERDALAAVLYALKKYEKAFRMIDSTEILSNLTSDLAKGLVIRGLSVKDAIDGASLLTNKEEVGEEFTPEKIDNLPQTLGRLRNLLTELATSEDIMSNLRAHSGRLEGKIESQSGTIKFLKRRLRNKEDSLLRRMLKDELIESKQTKIRFLELKLKKERIQNQLLRDQNRSFEKVIWYSVNQNMIPIKVLKTFSSEGIYQLRKTIGLEKDDILLILDPSGGGPQTSTPPMSGRSHSLHSSRSVAPL
ncbi:MAG: DUF460 domain-containing protein, partial [Candidatus Heimdallarchaeota archaeon]|nr:DUF460 domain-containing protein [Candidatus Heimdallarchaeota archaeon]